MQTDAYKQALQHDLNAALWPKTKGETLCKPTLINKLCLI